MKIDFSQPITDLEGNAIKADGGDLTLGFVSINALLTPLEGDKQLKGEDKCEHLELAERLYNQAEVEIGAVELAILKKRIGKLYSTLPAGRALALLEREI
jgi:hypothetical protein